MTSSPFNQTGCLIIAEVAQAHDGSLGLAHSFIDAAARTGVDAIKFQMHLAQAESTREEPWRVPFSLQDRSRFEYWERMEFTEEQWEGLRSHAREAGLLFVCSPFSLEAVTLLERLEIDAWKIASGETSNLPMLRAVADHDQPIMLSTGMSGSAELDIAVETVKSRGRQPILMQCTSKYPSGPEDLGLNVIQEFRERYGVPVGLSDHSGTIYAGIAAATLGIAALEVHLTLSRDMFGPDVAVSLTPPELRDLVEGVRFVEAALAHPVDKDSLVEDLSPMRKAFGRSIATVCDLEAGEVLQADHLTLKKPATGMPPEALDRVVGRRLRRPVKSDRLLREEDLEEES